MAERSSAERKPRTELEQMIKDEPLKAVAIAAGLGFFTGGGLRSRTARAVLVLVGRIAARTMVSNYIMGAVFNAGGRGNFENRK
ncbi:MAG: hypothetical protein Q7S58_16690 [Candidatus Binatus sp.]|uniref:hypothetical protein n=1 Tax=Candidatus Binatus sp. TaxID=2811406 RepID=UPI00271FFBFE|nr:hypothetical protein [Candidatus Binatus sp.]MDO8434037.1 hypothetical protein [Candidatus Binatus sp.]